MQEQSSQAQTYKVTRVNRTPTLKFVEDLPAFPLLEPHRFLACLICSSVCSSLSHGSSDMQRGIPSEANLAAISFISSLL